MILEDFIMLVNEQPRARAYIQKMVDNNLLPNFVIYLNPCSNNMDFKPNKKENAHFDASKSVLSILFDYNIDFVSLDTQDCNDQAVLECLKDRKESYVIYGASGILKKQLLSIDKKFIHVHPGRVPEYRGSTCMYYSIIKDDECATTAFFMNSGIDQGDIILQNKYSKPYGVNIDHIYDSFIRSETLLDVLKLYIKEGELKGLKQNINEGETYYVMHPILKHLSISKCNKDKEYGEVYWFIGLSGSGKTTLANEVVKEFLNRGKKVKLIDGDDLRKALNGSLGYSIEERRKSANLVIYLAKTLSESGINIVIANQGAFEDLRKKARREIAKYNEIFVKCTLEECINRDVKGLYKKALAGEIKDFLGVDQKFEEPENSDLIIDTNINSIEESVEIFKKYINKD